MSSNFMVKETHKVNYSIKKGVCLLCELRLLVNKFNFKLIRKTSIKLSYSKKSMFYFYYLNLDFIMQKLADLINYSFSNIFFNNINISPKKTVNKTILTFEKIIFF